MPSNPEAWMENQINSCLPTAIAFREGLRRHDVWSEVFRYSFYDSRGKLSGHAMVAYMYPKGSNQLWTYDALGSWRIRAYKNNVAQIAREASKVRGSYSKTFNARFIK